MKIFSLLILISVFIISCGEDDYIKPPELLVSKFQSAENLKMFYGSSMKNLYVRVFYEPGAEPYAGDNSRGQPVWGLLEQNIREVFTKRNQNVGINVPKELNEMTAVPDQGKDAWTAQEIVDLANTLGVAPTSAESSFFTIVFLKGAFKSGENISNTVLGVSLSGTTIIAIFKDAIRSMGPSDESMTVKFGEQATLVHEMGHALGVVGNGVNAVTDHHDEEHGSHCSNTNCVMYWMNEGNKDLLEFIQGIVQNGNTTLYGDQCLDDIKAYTP